MNGLVLRTASLTLETYFKMEWAILRNKNKLVLC